MVTDGGWLCAGLSWSETGPGWRWLHPRHGGRRSPLALGGPVALSPAPGTARRCVGVWRSGRWTPCPAAAPVPAAGTRGQCPACAALDRTYSVAADTATDDPRPYRVYLAWFGPGRCKVGITGEHRGAARLLGQGAVCFTFLARGPLGGARRAEAVLGAALGLPDRVSGAAKRAARTALPPPETRTAELRARYDAALGVPEWRDTLTALPFALVDQTAAFGLSPGDPPPTREVTALLPGTVLRGTVAAVAGADLHVRVAGHADADAPHAETVLLDTRLTAGWTFTTPPSPVAPTPPTRPRPSTTAHLF
jgi:hypothetical protein